MDAAEKIYAGLDINAQATLFRVKDDKPVAIKHAEWCEMLDAMSAAPGELVRAYLHREDEPNPYFNDDEFDVPDEEERPGRPANPDGSVRVDQLGLFCGILNHLCQRHPGLKAHADQLNVIREAADRIVEAYAKPVA